MQAGVVKNLEYHEMVILMIQIQIILTIYSHTPSQ